MPFKEKILVVAKEFPGITEPERLNILNSQLLDLKDKGFNNLINNFLSAVNPYTLIPFIFEIYICRWLHSIRDGKNIFYEPIGYSKPPDFFLQISDIKFQIEAKAITQITNETIKKKIVKQINNRIGPKTRNLIEIWLSENIEVKKLNSIVDWITKETITMNLGEKREYYFNDAGRQMRVLGESVKKRYLQFCGEDSSIPEEYYQGEYIKEIAAELYKKHGQSLKETEDISIFSKVLERHI